MARRYKIIEGGIHHRFADSRAKVQMFAGGFGNGKTTGAVIKTLRIAKEYPGANILVARSTYPKLNDTIRKEVLAWCPTDWIESFSKSDNVLVLKNKTVINFRYIAQQGKSSEQSTSNLLSATYDLVVVDQVEDPEISEKDFLDLMGRLRGQTRYMGDDPSMPSSGPRWMILMCNPTRNWVYRKLVKPLHDFAAGIHNPELLADDEGNPLIDIFEGSTYENKENLPEDFISGLEITYKGQMRDRFLKGEWGAYEGLVYPQYSPFSHMLPHHEITDYFEQLHEEGFAPNIIHSYDHGIASPACYLFGFADHDNNVFVMDGFYKKERTVLQLSDEMKEIHAKYRMEDFFDVEEDDDTSAILADPAVFKRATGRTGAVTVSGLFDEHGIKMRRAENDILSGIAKVQSYLAVDKRHFHPTRQTVEAPRLYFSNNLDFIDKEIVDYIWARNPAGEYEDKPRDKDDHAMDALKYLLSFRPRLATFLRRPKRNALRYPRQWTEKRVNTDRRSSRYG